jgi:hypothetical protein
MTFEAHLISFEKLNMAVMVIFFKRWRRAKKMRINILKRKRVKGKVGLFRSLF